MKSNKDADKESPVENQPVDSKAASKKPAAKKTCAKKTTKPAKKPAASKDILADEIVMNVPVDLKEPLTEEEKRRLAKLTETVKLLNADPEWPAFIAEQTTALLDLRASLVPNMTSVTKEHLRSGASNESSSSGQHIGDAGSDAEVRDLTIRLLDKDREQLFEIDAALGRIKRGVYGVCEISLLPIPKGRLRVRPFCRLTVKCQEEYEKKHGTASLYRTPESDIIGYAGVKNDGESNISLDDAE